MAEIVNLKSVRKAKARTEKMRVAEANRAKFGRTREERLNEDADRTRAARELDGKRIDE